MKKYTFGEHFAELKGRLVKILISFTVAFIISYIYSENLYEFFLSPLAILSPDSLRKVIYTGLTEAFFTYMKLACFSAFFSIFPIICYQLYAFISPGLVKWERIIARFTLLLSPILLFLGACFVFYLVMPKAWAFFLGFENKDMVIPLVLEARISEYLSLVMQLILAFGIAFQLPIFMVIMALLNLIDSGGLKKYRRIAIVINFIFAAIFTPPDIISQFALAIPLILLYEISILMCKLLENQRKK